MALCARQRRGLLRRRAGGAGDRGQPLHRRGRRGAGRGRLRHPAVRRRRAEGRVRTAGAPRAELQRHHHLQGELRRHRRGIRQSGARVQAGAMAAPRRGAFDRGARHHRGNPQRRRRHHRPCLDAEGARPPANADHAARHGREPARRRARYRRRLRRQALRLFRGRRRGRSGEAAEPLAEMDRGSPRVFHQRGARARPVLGAGDRGRRRGARARHPRQALARHRRLHGAGPEHSVQFGVDHERALRDPRAQHRRHHRDDQHDAGVVGARRRLSAGVVRDGAAARPGVARDEARPRRGAPPQPDPAAEDAVPEADQGALRRDHPIRQRRLSGLPGRGACGDRLGRFPHPPGGGAEGRPPSRHRPRRMA